MNFSRRVFSLRFNIYHLRRLLCSPLLGTYTSQFSLLEIGSWRGVIFTMNFDLSVRSTSSISVVSKPLPISKPILHPNGMNNILTNRCASPLSLHPGSFNDSSTLSRSISTDDSDDDINSSPLLDDSPFCIGPPDIRSYKSKKPLSSLQMAVKMTFNRALDKSLTFTVWSCGLYSSLHDSLSSHEFKKREHMVAYAIHDVLAPTSLNPHFYGPTKSSFSVSISRYPRSLRLHRCHCVSLCQTVMVDSFSPLSPRLTIIELQSHKQDCNGDKLATHSSAPIRCCKELISPQSFHPPPLHFSRSVRTRYVRTLRALLSISSLTSSISFAVVTHICHTHRRSQWVFVFHVWNGERSFVLTRLWRPTSRLTTITHSPWLLLTTSKFWKSTSGENT